MDGVHETIRALLVPMTKSGDVRMEQNGRGEAGGEGAGAAGGGDGGEEGVGDGGEEGGADGGEEGGEEGGDAGGEEGGDGRAVLREQVARRRVRVARHVKVLRLYALAERRKGRGLVEEPRSKALVADDLAEHRAARQRRLGPPAAAEQPQQDLGPPLQPSDHLRLLLVRG